MHNLNKSILAEKSFYDKLLLSLVQIGRVA